MRRSKPKFRCTHLFEIAYCLRRIRRNSQSAFLRRTSWIVCFKSSSQKLSRPQSTPDEPPLEVVKTYQGYIVGVEDQNDRLVSVRLVLDGSDRRCQRSALAEVTQNLRDAMGTEDGDDSSGDLRNLTRRFLLGTGLMGEDSASQRIAQGDGRRCFRGEETLDGKHCSTVELHEKEHAGIPPSKFTWRMATSACLLRRLAYAIIRLSLACPK